MYYILVVSHMSYLSGVCESQHQVYTYLIPTNNHPYTIILYCYRTGMKLLKKLSIPVLEAGTDPFYKKICTKHWSWLVGWVFWFIGTMGSGYLNISQSERTAQFRFSERIRSQKNHGRFWSFWKPQRTGGFHEQTCSLSKASISLFSSFPMLLGNYLAKCVATLKHCDLEGLSKLLFRA
jgi:hypothetical protein